MNFTTISSLERGKSSITEATAKLIEKEYGVGLDWLYYGDEKARDYPIDDEMLKYLKAHPELRKEIHYLVRVSKKITSTTP